MSRQTNCFCYYGRHAIKNTEIRIVALPNGQILTAEFKDKDGLWSNQISPLDDDVLKLIKGANDGTVSAKHEAYQHSRSVDTIKGETDDAAQATARHNAPGDKERLALFRQGIIRAVAPVAAPPHPAPVAAPALQAHGDTANKIAALHKLALIDKDNEINPQGIADTLTKLLKLPGNKNKSAMTVAKELIDNLKNRNIMDPNANPRHRALVKEIFAQAELRTQCATLQKKCETVARRLKSLSDEIDKQESIAKDPKKSPEDQNKAKAKIPHLRAAHKQMWDIFEKTLKGPLLALKSALDEYKKNPDTLLEKAQKRAQNALYEHEETLPETAQLLFSIRPIETEALQEVSKTYPTGSANHVILTTLLDEITALNKATAKLKELAPLLVTKEGKKAHFTEYKAATQEAINHSNKINDFTTNTDNMQLIQKAFGTKNQRELSKLVMQQVNANNLVVQAAENEGQVHPAADHKIVRLSTSKDKHADEIISGGTSKYFDTEKGIKTKKHPELVGMPMSTLQAAVAKWNADHPNEQVSLKKNRFSRGSTLDCGTDERLQQVLDSAVNMHKAASKKDESNASVEEKAKGKKEVTIEETLQPPIPRGQVVDLNGQPVAPTVHHAHHTKG